MNLRRFIQTLAVILLLWPLPAAAHAGGTPVLTDVAAGPYRVYAWMQPEPLRVGEVHLSVVLVRPTQSATQQDALDEPVTDANVMARFEPVGDETQRISVPVAPLQGLGGFYYEADVVLAQTGLWQISLEIDGADGQGLVRFERQVEPARRVNWQLVIGAGAILVLLVGLVGGWNRLQTRE